jgi:hypothetical protein
MSKPQRARRYLQASMESGYTGLPDEHRKAKESLMASHERAYPGVREHALAGTDQDFDEPLTAGEREHQKHLRRQEGLDHGQILQMRRDLRGQSAGNTPSRRSTTGRGRRVVRTLTNQTGVAPAASDAGSLALKTLGVLFGLSIVYLLVNDEHGGQGPKAFSGLLKLVTGALQVAIGPVDPLGQQTMQILGASAPAATAMSAAPSPTSSSRSTPIGGPRGSNTMRRRLNPAFGPAPGIPTPLTALGG